MIHISKRRSERVHTTLRGFVCRKDELKPVTITDVNLHGMFVRTDEPSVVGRIEILEVYFADGSGVELFGKVCWVGQSAAGLGMGIEILAMSAVQAIVGRQGSAL